MALGAPALRDQLADAVGERANVERLALEVVAAGLDRLAANLRLHRGAAREEHRRGYNRVRARPYGTGDVEARHPGQSKVEDDQLRSSCLDRAQGLFARSRLDDPEPSALEDATHQTACLHHVVDNQDQR